MQLVEPVLDDVEVVVLGRVVAGFDRPGPDHEEATVRSDIVLPLTTARAAPVDTLEENPRPTDPAAVELFGREAAGGVIQIYLKEKVEDGTEGR